MIVADFRFTMGLFLQKQNPIFCKREGFVVTFFDNRNAIMDSHLGFKRMVACPVYNDITFSD